MHCDFKVRKLPLKITPFKKPLQSCHIHWSVNNRSFTKRWPNFLRKAKGITKSGEGAFCAIYSKTQSDQLQRGAGLGKKCLDGRD